MPSIRQQLTLLGKVCRRFVACRHGQTHGRASVRALMITRARVSVSDPDATFCIASRNYFELLPPRVLPILPEPILLRQRPPVHPHSAFPTRVAA
jgi:hypothetical protein